MSYFEWARYAAKQHEEYAKCWSEKAEAREAALKEAILLINYGAREEAIELLGKHGIIATIKDRT